MQSTHVIKRYSIALRQNERTDNKRSHNISKTTSFTDTAMNYNDIQILSVANARYFCTLEKSTVLIVPRKVVNVVE